ncbi:DUF4274 domain-containing protein [uncultured Kordia sp.]|uniref:DUF4274 domain-containing protein n=1 Tax=uncultured Kordia sp. TaxID=507699 RepID=UPI0026320A7B|nr:DUF4274 domain-containing protein [uncultured Kordia sp.]
MKIFHVTKRRMYSFIESDLSPIESTEEYDAIKEQVKELKDTEFENRLDHFTRSLEYHHKRHQKGELFEDFMKQEFPAPTIRVCSLFVDFEKDNYDFMKVLAKNTKKSVQELADFMWKNKMYFEDYVDANTGEIKSITSRSYDDTFNFSNFPSIIKLRRLRKMNVMYVTDEIVDFTTIADESLFLEKLNISAFRQVKKVILTGGIQECIIDFVENLELLDCTRIDPRNSHYFSSSYNKNNGPCIITEAQKQHGEPFTKFRWKKETVPSTTEEIHQLAKHYNWDNGSKFLKWAIKQPNCDKGTALLIYWLGSPEWYSQFASKKEVDSWAQDGYALLAAIEKRMKKDDFKTYNYKFNLDKHLDNKPVNYPENKVRDIPAYMMVND